MTKRAPIPIISFFTGGGFLDLGFEQAGFESVWTNEFNDDIADMYSHGMTALRWKKNPDAPLVSITSRKSISLLKPTDILHEAFKEKPPKCFGVIGGPPCPDFSVGGKNRGHTGDHGKLTQSYINMVIALKPTFFLMENVPGLLRTSKHKTFLDKIRKQLKEAGYITDLKILNALEYGVPQDRERVFLIGLTKQQFHKSICKRISNNRADGWFPYPEPKYKGAKDYPWPQPSSFGLMPEKPKGIPKELTVYPLLASTPQPSELANGTEGFTPYSSKFQTIEEGDVSKKSFKRLHRHRFSPTACYGNNEVHLHPWEPRRLTVREALRIQTMPDEYVLPADKTLSIKFKMIGNGVPRILGKAIAESIKAIL
ncbi:MAG TPA: DNA (cytosine-5-)-methyltransferase [Opitutae bacterium]|nr:DNA (cytosine-5-)-methyltransferase [Puniceicoccaceae bacterium]HBR94056.1 DNA (cytosine-5-)-methyltransferase [Opitutae bacterium]|tara:strand:- start:4565 stop:5671 length:1107 start_codon:yes stop_codon:yes gene_type:complete